VFVGLCVRLRVGLLAQNETNVDDGCTDDDDDDDDYFLWPVQSVLVGYRCLKYNRA
jgi:hypothetical protein